MLLLIGGRLELMASFVMRNFILLSKSDKFIKKLSRMKILVEEVSTGEFHECQISKCDLSEIPLQKDGWQFTYWQRSKELNSINLP
jgi:hypothetical protein